MSGPDSTQRLRMATKADASAEDLVRRHGSDTLAYFTGSAGTVGKRRKHLPAQSV